MLLEEIKSDKLLLLKKALTHEDAWRQVAAQFDLNPTHHLKEPSASGLILALYVREKTVEDLKDCLLALDLRYALSCISEPEKLRILRQPYIEETDDCFWIGDILHVRAGGTLHLKIDVIGTPLPSFQWYHDNVALSASPELKLGSFSRGMEGLYHCSVQQLEVGWNRRVISSDVTVKIAVKIHYEPPRVIKVYPTKECQIESGEELMASVKVLASPKQTFSWWHNNKKLGCTSSTLKIPSADTNCSGKYECCIKNDTGEKREKFVFQVKEKCFPTAKTALIIANSNYDLELHTPQNDAKTLQQCLTEDGFQCSVKSNQTAKEMLKEIRIFCSHLKEGAYVLFYFGGHGLKEEISSHKLMLGCDAKLSNLANLTEEYVDEAYVLQEVQKRKPLFFASILDMCQTAYTLRHFKPNQCNENVTGSVMQCYATSFNRPAFEEKGCQNSIYMKHLQDVLKEKKDLPFTATINQVIERVTKEVPEQKPSVTYAMERHDFKLSDNVRQSDGIA